MDIAFHDIEHNDKLAYDCPHEINKLSIRPSVALHDATEVEPTLLLANLYYGHAQACFAWTLWQNSDNNSIRYLTVFAALYLEATMRTIKEVHDLERVLRSFVTYRKFGSIWAFSITTFGEAQQLMMLKAVVNMVKDIRRKKHEIAQSINTVRLITDTWPALPLPDVLREAASTQKKGYLEDLFTNFGKHNDYTFKVNLFEHIYILKKNSSSSLPIGSIPYEEAPELEA